MQTSKAATFQGVAAEWMAKQSMKWVETTIVHTQAKLDKHILPWIGSLPIADIEAPDVLALVQRAEKRGTIETAHRLKMLCSQIFRYGIATGKIFSVLLCHELQGCDIFLTMQPMHAQPIERVNFRGQSFVLLT